MSEKRGRPLADLPHRLRERVADLPSQWRELREGFREHPGRFWRGPIVRIGGLVLLGIVALVGVHWLIGAIGPAGAHPSLQKPTPWATLYVACTNPACQAHYTTQQPMDFKDWPLKCTQCGADAVYRATRCKACGRWFAVTPGTPRPCPFCAQKKAGQQPHKPAHTPSGVRDDDEDPW